MYVSVSQLPVYIFFPHTKFLSVYTEHDIFTKKKKKAIQRFSTIYIVFIFYAEQIHFLTHEICIFLKNIFFLKTYIVYFRVYIG